jgi:hypothetical protein
VVGRKVAKRADEPGDEEGGKRFTEAELFLAGELAQNFQASHCVPVADFIGNSFDSDWRSDGIGCETIYRIIQLGHIVMSKSGETGCLVRPVLDVSPATEMIVWARCRMHLPWTAEVDNGALARGLIWLLNLYVGVYCNYGIQICEFDVRIADRSNSDRSNFSEWCLTSFASKGPEPIGWISESNERDDPSFRLSDAFTVFHHSFDVSDGITAENAPI